MVAWKLASRDGGHNKFLESMMIWVLVQAPRYWWQEADTYRLSTKQSESTMHTLVKELQRITKVTNLVEHEASLRQWAVDNFEDQFIISQDTLNRLQMLAVSGDLVGLKGLLPEGFLQRRVWCFSYKTLRNMILQRRNHRLPHWKCFLKETLEHIDHPELLPGVCNEKD